MKDYALFRYWIVERHAIWERRLLGCPKPWTLDAILQSYRFCNAYRELDTVTEWITDNWRSPHAHDPDLWFAMCVARLINWPDTLQALGYPVPWNAARFVAVLHARKATGKAFGGAYIVSTNGHKMDKAEYLAQHVLTPLWSSRAALRPHAGDTLGAFHTRLQEFNGMGSFMAAQVVADVKYVMPLRNASDWFIWAASGPGSRRGLNRLLGRETGAPWREADWRAELFKLHTRILTDLPKHMPSLHAQDLQNCLCEFDKYMRVKLGEGKPRAGYPGT